MIGASLLPVLIVAVTWRGGLALPALALAAGVGLVLLVAEWRRFTYRVEGGRLVIERGLLRHQTRIVPLDRIRGVELQAPWLHRVLGLVRVDVEAAAGGSSKPELSLAAVSLQEGERLRQVLLSRAALSDREQAEGPPAPALYRATRGLLVVGGLTSGRHILAPLAVIGLVANFADDLPGSLGDQLWSEAGDRLSADVLTVTIAGAALLLLALVFAAAGSLLADWEFELADEGDRLIARRGLLTQRVVAIDRARVRGLDLRDSPLRRAFDLAGVTAIAGGVGGGRSGRTVLAPVITTSAAWELMRAVDPLVRPRPELERHPRAARTRRLLRAIVAPLAVLVVAAALGWWWAALPALLLLVAAVPLALDRYRQLGHRFDGRRLFVRKGSLQRRWTSLDPHAVVSYAVERSPGQARAGLCSVVLHLGQGAGSRQVLDCSEEQAADLLAALDPPLLAPFVATPPAAAA
jgi:putative membrane protein